MTVKHIKLEKGGETVGTARKEQGGSVLRAGTPPGLSMKETEMWKKRGVTD